MYIYNVLELHHHRGGCVMCLDYSHFAIDSAYFRLVRHFDPLAGALTALLQRLQLIGFALERGYVFGFSFGGQLAVEAGRRVAAVAVAAVAAAAAEGQPVVPGAHQRQLLGAIDSKY